MSDRRQLTRKRKSGSSEQQRSPVAPAPPAVPSSIDLGQLVADWDLSDDSDEDSSPTPVTVIHRGLSWTQSSAAIDPSLSSSIHEASETLDEVPLPEGWASPGMSRKMRRISSPPLLFGKVPLTSTWTPREEMEVCPSTDEEEPSTSTWSRSKGREKTPGEVVPPSSEEDDEMSPDLLDQGLIADSDDDWCWGQGSPPQSAGSTAPGSTATSPIPQQTSADVSMTAPTGRQYVYKTTSKIDIDPFAVGLAAMQAALRDNARLDAELAQDEAGQSGVGGEGPCPCDVATHPPRWSDATITAVHRYSFLLDCQELVIERERVLAANARETFVVYDVPMVDGHAWKKKAEQVLRYLDVELGLGDQTAFNVLHYHQPCDRKVYLVLSGGRVQGLVVGEAVRQAHRVLTETVHYRDLEPWPVATRLGINRLWVHVSLRRRHLATALCDLMALKFFKDEKLKKEDIAFNDLTDSGAAFAKIYLKTFKVPLYTGKTGSRR